MRRPRGRGGGVFRGGRDGGARGFRGGRFGGRYPPRDEGPPDEFVDSSHSEDDNSYSPSRASPPSNFEIGGSSKFSTKKVTTPFYNTSAKQIFEKLKKSNKGFMTTYFRDDNMFAQGKGLDEVMGLFDDMGWVNLFDVDEYIYPSIVYEFGANLRKEEDDGTDIRYKSCVGKLEFVFSEKIFCEAIGIKHVEYAKRFYKNTMSSDDIGLLDMKHFISQFGIKGSFTDAKEREIDKLDEFGRILHFFVSNIVAPVKGHKSSITFLQMVIMQHLLERKALNFAHLALQHFIAAIKGSRNFIPYGNILTRLFQRFGLDLQNPLKKKFVKVDEACFYRMKMIYIDNQWKFIQRTTNDEIRAAILARKVSHYMLKTLQKIEKKKGGARSKLRSDPTRNEQEDFEAHNSLSSSEHASSENGQEKESHSPTQETSKSPPQKVTRINKMFALMKKMASKIEAITEEIVFIKEKVQTVSDKVDKSIQMQKDLARDLSLSSADEDDQS